MIKLQDVLVMGVANPYTQKLVNLLGEVKGWILGIIAAVTVVVIAINSCKYLQGDGSEKAESIANIKKNLYMGGGVFFLVWFAGQVIDAMK